MKLLMFIGSSLLVVLSHYSGTLECAVVQTKSHSDTRIIDSLPPPKDQEIRKIRTAGEWHNPYIIVFADGYELILHDQKRDSAHLTMNELENTLLDVPSQRWPLGRVVAVQETGLRSPDDNSKIASNLRLVKRMFESHKIRVDQWPSA
jgi:hypothetical protein